MSNENLYIFLDEGGNLDFSSSGTKYFTITSVCKKRPFKISHTLGKLKFDLIEFGLDFEFFHCTKNNKHVRKQVFKILKKNITTLRIDSLIVEKRKTGPALRAVQYFYPRMLGYLLRFIVENRGLNDIEEVFVMTDTIPINKKRKAVEKAVKKTLKAMLPSECKYRILHHSSRSSIGLQIADYCNWAIFRKWEAGKCEFYDEIKSGIESEFDIFRSGSKYYY